MAVMKPELIMKCIIPVIMAGIVAIYGLVVAVVIGNGMTTSYTLYHGFLDMGAGLSVGLSGLAAGFAIGIYLLNVFVQNLYRRKNYALNFKQLTKKNSNLKYLHPLLVL